MDEQKTVLQQCNIALSVIAKKDSFQDAKGANSVIRTVNRFLHHTKSPWHYVTIILKSQQNRSKPRINEISYQLGVLIHWLGWLWCTNPCYIFSCKIKHQNIFSCLTCMLAVVRTIFFPQDKYSWISTGNLSIVYIYQLRHNTHLFVFYRFIKNQLE